MDRAAFALHVPSRGCCASARRVAGARSWRSSGPGNNGGDTLYAGAHLARRGVRCAPSATSRVHEGGLAALRGAGGRGAAARRAAVESAAAPRRGADVVLDGLLGIGAGGSRAARARRATLVEALAGRCGRARSSSPSTCRAASGSTTGAARDRSLAADLTVTFGAAKPGLLLPPADARAGRVEVVDLGLGLAGAARRRAARAGRRRRALAGAGAPTRRSTRAGVLGVVAGTRAYPGAAVLTSSAAVRAGVGMVRYLGTSGTAVVAARPEVVAGDGRVQAWVSARASPRRTGRGGASGGRARAVLARGERPWSTRGALAAAARRVGPPVVLTPHAGELARLLDAARGGGRAGRTSRRSRCAGRGARASSPARRCCSRARSPSSRARRERSTRRPTRRPGSRRPGRATCWPGCWARCSPGRADAVHADPSLVAALAAAAALVHGARRTGRTPAGRCRRSRSPTRCPAPSRSCSRAVTLTARARRPRGRRSRAGRAAARDRRRTRGRQVDRLRGDRRRRRRPPWSSSPWTASTSHRRELERLGRAGRKGAPDTFDAGGFVALLGDCATPGADGLRPRVPARAAQRGRRGPSPCRTRRRWSSSRGTTCCSTTDGFAPVRGHARPDLVPRARRGLRLDAARGAARRVRQGARGRPGVALGPDERNARPASPAADGARPTVRDARPTRRRVLPVDR